METDRTQQSLQPSDVMGVGAGKGSRQREKQLNEKVTATVAELLKLMLPASTTSATTLIPQTSASGASGTATRIDGHAAGASLNNTAGGVKKHSAPQTHVWTARVAAGPRRKEALGEEDLLVHPGGSGGMLQAAAGGGGAQGNKWGGSVDMDAMRLELDAFAHAVDRSLGVSTATTASGGDVGNQTPRVSSSGSGSSMGMLFCRKLQHDLEHHEYYRSRQ